MRRSIPALLLPPALLSLAACAKDQGDYPSLARRPVERITGTAPVVTPTPEPSPAEPAAELTDSLARLVAKAEAADSLFHQHAPRTRALVAAASGAAMASESWSVATVALADLESQRSQAMIALADLDALYAAEAVKLNDAAAIRTARDQVIAMIAREDAVLADLKGRLAG